MSHHASPPLDDLPPALKIVGLGLGFIGMVGNLNDFVTLLGAIGSFSIGFVTVANFAINSIARVAAWNRARKAGTGK